MSKVILLTGPAGAGKSTTAEELAKSSDGTWAFICQDDIRHFVKSGFSNPSKDWTDETQKQWDVSIKICSDTIKTYYKNSINVVADVFITPTKLYIWKSKLKGVDFKLIVLLPSKEVTYWRNTMRPEDEVMTEKMIYEHHNWHSQWNKSEAKIIDSSNLSVKEVIEVIQS